jgi:TonB family protein
MNGDNTDKQRALEKKALESVRNLVDTLEEEDRHRSAKALKRTIIIFAIIAVAIVIAVPVVRYVQALNRKPEVMKPTREMGTAEYVEQSLAKIERLSNTKGQSAMEGFDGRVQVNIAIGIRGYINNMEVTKSSGDSRLDGIVTKLVKVSEPFGPLPAEVKTNELDVKRTFRIERPASGRSKFSVEAD